MDFVDHALPALTVQGKLAVSRAGDRFEREADRVADHVMRMSDGQVAQRARSGCQDELQRAPTGVGGRVGALGGGGRPLTAGERAFFEPRFGADFSTVRLHTGPRADRAARSVQARAFTLGRDVVFRADEYNPATRSGKRLMAHELTHVLQQGAAGVAAPDPAGSVQRWAASPAISRTTEPVLQREVGPAEVRSAQVVLGRIRSTVARADATNPLRGRHARLALRVLGVPAPAFRHLWRLLCLSRAFNPGAARDAAGNAFVYTCRGGWIDLGHFFFSATTAYLFGYQSAMTAGYLMEDPYQRFFYDLAGVEEAGARAVARRWTRRILDNPAVSATRDAALRVLGAVSERAAAAQQLINAWGLSAPRAQALLSRVGQLSAAGIRALTNLRRTLREAFSGLIQGNARSHYTIEDLPSDHFGSRLGAHMRGFWTQEFDIHAAMSGFFSNQGAVFPTGDRLDAMMRETRPGYVRGGNPGVPRQHRLITPYLLSSAAPLCGRGGAAGRTPPATGAGGPPLVLQ